jgi:hypothetical protein
MSSQITLPIEKFTFVEHNGWRMATRSLGSRGIVTQYRVFVEKTPGSRPEEPQVGDIVVSADYLTLHAYSNDLQWHQYPAEKEKQMTIQIGLLRRRLVNLPLIPYTSASHGRNGKQEFWLSTSTLNTRKREREGGEKETPTYSSDKRIKVSGSLSEPFSEEIGKFKQ